MAKSSDMPLCSLSKRVRTEAVKLSLLQEYDWWTRLLAISSGDDRRCAAGPRTKVALCIRREMHFSGALRARRGLWHGELPDGLALSLSPSAAAQSPYICGPRLTDRNNRDGILGLTSTQ